MINKPKAIAFEARLRECKNVMTLGVRTNFAAMLQWAVQSV
ncbi:MAG: hypothetical protein ACE5HX_18070 [bacterium]